MFRVDNIAVRSRQYSSAWERRPQRPPFPPKTLDTGGACLLTTATMGVIIPYEVV